MIPNFLMEVFGVSTGGPKLDIAQESMLPVYSMAECKKLLVYEVVHEWSTRLCAGQSGTRRGICPVRVGPSVCVCVCIGVYRCV